MLGSAPLRPFTLSATLLIGLEVWKMDASAADDAPPPVDIPATTVGSLWLQADYGHDSNPTEGGTHALRVSHGTPDSFVEWQGSGKLSLPLAPGLALVVRERDDDREYQGDLPEDTALLHHEVELPIAVARSASVTPFSYLEDQWYGHDYYGTYLRSGLRWTENWSMDWTSDLTPYLERDRYRPPNRIQDATISGIDGTLTWWAPAGWWLRALVVGAGGALASAHADYASYKQDDVNCTQMYTLPGKLRADLLVDWSPTYYQDKAPGTRKLRQDRPLAIALHLERALVRRLVVVADGVLTSVRSDFPADQYHEIVLSAGLRFIAW